MRPRCVIGAAFNLSSLKDDAMLVPHTVETI